eukprot:1345357-Prymnesium_polylepis.1
MSLREWAVCAHASCQSWHVYLKARADACGSRRSMTDQSASRNQKRDCVSHSFPICPPALKAGEKSVS